MIVPARFLRLATHTHTHTAYRTTWLLLGDEIVEILIMASIRLCTYLVFS